MTKFNQIKLKEIGVKRINAFSTTFEIEPLERGFGITLGNALRRTLLSSIESLSPFAVKIKGVSNEFTTIEGVHEDVVNIILNIKGLVFKAKTEVQNDEIFTVSLPKSNEKVVYAKDLELPVGLEVINKDHIIATITSPKKQVLAMEIYLKKGRGIVPFSTNKEIVKSVNAKIDSKVNGGEIIAIDSNFIPITNVAYEVEELNSIAEDIEEKLRITVTTNGSVEVKDAISQAALILKSHLEAIEGLTQMKMSTDIFEKSEPLKEELEVMKIPIVDLELSVRSYNALKRMGISQVSELATMSHEDLTAIDHLGVKSIQEIETKLSELGIKVSSKGDQNER